MKCPKCGSENVEVNGLYYKCLHCGQLDDSTFSMIMEACGHEGKLKDECPKCGSIYYTKVFRPGWRDEPHVCQTCGHEEKLKDGEG